MTRWFDADGWPRVVVKAAFSDDTSRACEIGTGIIGTDLIGGRSMVDISADVRSVVWRRGRDSDIDVATPGTCTIILNNISGDYDPTNPAGTYITDSGFYDDVYDDVYDPGGVGVSLVDIGAAVTVQAERPAGMFYDRFTGTIADIAIDAGEDPTVTLTCADGLEDLGRAQLPVEAPEFDGDTTGERIANLADRAAWPALARALDVGEVILGPTTLGASALELMHRVETSEFGLLFVDEHGNLVFYGRHRAATANRSVLVQAALTDTSAAGELGMVELVLSLSRERVFNDVHVTREASAADPDEEPVEQIAQDAASIARYGILSFPTQVGQLLKADPEALNLAEGLVALYATPQVRIREVTVNALREHPDGDDLWPVLLPLGLLDRISVVRSYGASHTVTAELLIQSVAEEITSDPPGWQLRFTTSEPPVSVDDNCVIGEGLIGTAAIGW